MSVNVGKFKIYPFDKNFIFGKMIWRTEKRRIGDLVHWDLNPHTMDDTELKNLTASLERFDYVEPVAINTNNVIIGGHQRIKVLLAQGKQDLMIDVRVPDRELTEAQHKELAVRLNKNRGHDDDDLLREFFSKGELSEWGFGADELDKIFDEGIRQLEFSTLNERFMIPPFSVFDSRQGYWQDRKKEWNSKFNSQETRENVEVIAKSGQTSSVYNLRNNMRERMGREPEWDEILCEAKKRGMYVYGGASMFDPVLAEICYKWFCPEGGTVLDPFAGGCARGIVAAMLGFRYFGIDLREDQVAANEHQVCSVKGAAPIWIVGDSNEVLDKEGIPQVDFVFSCPPYHDLERYSDNPADLSNMGYAEFSRVYRSIITKAMGKLREDRFACFVVGDIRDEKGFYRGFVPETIDCFTKCGDVHLYNDIILVNVAGSLPIRAGRQFENSRKVGKMHQNVLVFYKGNPKKINENFTKINMEEYLHELNYQPNIALSIID